MSVPLHNKPTASASRRFRFVPVLDISKCFDTINHSIIFIKMEKCGFRSNNIDWFRSYFLNRQQLVSCHNKLSCKCKLDISVPQGSVLGPILFVLYVNDISRHGDIGECTLYADDTLSLSHLLSHYRNLQECIQRCDHNVKEWYDKKQLVINTSKSNFMIVTTMQRDIVTTVPGIEIFLGDDYLTQLGCLDYLGVKLDSYLIWNVQVMRSVRNLFFYYLQVNRLKRVLASQIFMYIYHSIIQAKWLCSVHWEWIVIS